MKLFYSAGERLSKLAISSCSSQKLRLTFSLLIMIGLFLLCTFPGANAMLPRLIVPAIAVLAIIISFLFGYSGLFVAAPALGYALLSNLYGGAGSPAAADPAVTILLCCALGASLYIAVIKSRENNDQKNLEWLSVIDGLTETYNHRYFQLRLTEEVARADRNNSSLALAFLDLDNFKDYNDLHGHIIGDMALKKSAAFLNEGTRLHDVVCRYGGDEFVIILPGTDGTEALLMSERLINAFGQLQMPGGQSLRQVKLTLSVGISTYPEPGHSKKELVKQADKALYQAKKAGKNNVQVYSGSRYPNDGSAPGGLPVFPPADLAAGYFKPEDEKQSLVCVLEAYHEKKTGNGNHNGPKKNGKKINGSNGNGNKTESDVLGKAISLGHTNMDLSRLTAYIEEISVN